MVDESCSLKEVFRGILLALAVPVAGCGASTAIHTGAAPDAGSPDAVARPDVSSQPDDVSRPDVIHTDTVVPTDDGRCAPVAVRGSCAERVTYPCGVPELPAGAQEVWLPFERCAALCLPAFPSGGRETMTGCFALRADATGAAVMVDCAICAIGRRTQDFAPRASDGGDLVGRYLAAAAQLEAASVIAFRTLADELQAFGAPDDLVRDAREAAEQERRHARVVRTLALAHGSVPARVRLAPRATRGMEQVARENAVEGCVRETFGALVAHWQRDHAADASIRAAMEVIAEDETAHAALAWRTAAWLDAHLDEASRAEVRAARTAAVAGLAREIEAEVPAALVRDAGMPPRDIARAMLNGLRDARWS